MKQLLTLIVLLSLLFGFPAFARRSDATVAWQPAAHAIERPAAARKRPPGRIAVHEAGRCPASCWMAVLWTQVRDTPPAS